MNSRYLAIALFVSASAFAQGFHSDMAPRESVAQFGGTLAVGGNDGAAGYTYGFRLPPARGRYQPQLALVYSSNVRDALYGVGWKLTISYIESNNRASLASDGTPRLQYWLVLNGESRLLVSYPASQSTTYRPDVYPTYFVASYTPRAGSVNSYWTAKDAVGNSYRFDCSSSASAYCDQFGRWYLTSVVDVDGNTTNYAYVDETSNWRAPARLLSSISYNNYPPSSSFANTLELVYGTYPNPPKEAIQGSLITHDRLLTAINIKRQNPATGTPSLLYAYSMTYPQSATGRLVLTNITQLGTDGTTPVNAGTSFTYTTTSNSFTLSSALPVPALTGPQNLVQPSGTDCDNWQGTTGCSCVVSDVAAWIDIDDDGRPDLVWGSGGSGQTGGLRWARSLSSPTNTSNPAFADVEILPGSETWGGTVTFNNPGGDAVNMLGSTRLIDVDGDGRPDLVAAGGLGFTACGDQAVEVRFSRIETQGPRAGRPYFAAPICMDASAAYGDWFALNGVTPMQVVQVSNGLALVDILDLTGDGVLDYVIVSGTNLKVYPGYSTGAGWRFSSSALSIAIPAGFSAAVRRTGTGANRNTFQDWLDLNGDGLPDLVQSSGGTWNVAYNTGNGLLATPVQVSSGDAVIQNIAQGSGSSPKYFGSTIDLNRDGRPDYIYTASGNACVAGYFAISSAIQNGFSSAKSCVAEPYAATLAFIGPVCDINGCSCAQGPMRCSWTSMAMGCSITSSQTLDLHQPGSRIR